MAQPFVLDLIHESPLKNSGALKDWEHTDSGKKPVIKPLATKVRELFTPGQSSRVFPYELTDENIIRVSGTAKADVIVLIPDPSIPEYSDRDFKSSFYSKHLDNDTSDRLQSLREDLDQKEDKISRLRRDLDEATAEEEETQNTRNSGPPMLKCSFCDHSSRKKKWKSDDENDEDFCPSCGQGSISDAQEV